MWVADASTGKVKSTLKFSIPSTGHAFLPEKLVTKEDSLMSKTAPRTNNFSRISPFFFDLENRESTEQLVSWGRGSNVLYFIDTTTVQVVQWHADLGDIFDVRVMKTKLLILHGSNTIRSLSVIHVCTSTDFLDRLEVLHNGDLALILTVLISVKSTIFLY